MKHSRYFIYFLTICNLFCVISNGIAEELSSIHQTNLNLVERIARLEEGQKSIIVEMRTRFEAMEKRFESIDKRFESIEKRFESLIREMSHRFETMDKRIDSLENQISNLGTYIFAILAAIIALIAYVIWDRKTAFDKAFSESFKKIEQMFQLHIEKFHPAEPIVNQEDAFNERNMATVDHQKNEEFTIPINIQNKFRDVVNFMNQFPEMRPIMNAA
ncbi:MAG: hypothetical protein HQK75_16390 [Candidatus Magnetomorum sp.]|nr:hypothetical protein [Candidatus Magnetomorum sp.]